MIDVDTLRHQIDKLDGQIAPLLQRRLMLASLTGITKVRKGQAIRCLDREEAIHARYRGAAAGAPGQAIDAVAEAIVTECRRIQDKPRVAVIGGPLGWSEQTLRAWLQTAEVVHCETPRDALQAIDTGIASFAWLPLKNSSTGPIRSVHDATASRAPLFYQSFPILHAVMTLPDTAQEDVMVLRGHPEALAQCRKTLAVAFPDARLEPTPGAHAAAHCLPRYAAVVGHPAIAQACALKLVLHPAVDQTENATEFALFLSDSAHPSTASRNL